METSRAVENYDVLTDGASVVSISPDQRRIVIRLVRGDVQANVMVMTVLTASVDSKGALSPLSTVAVLRASGLYEKDSIKGPANDVDPYSAHVIWLDDRRVALLWPDAQGINQVICLDLVSSRQRFLTHHTTQVTNFAIGANGSILYTARARHDDDLTQGLLKHGFVVPERADLYGILHGYLDGTSAHDLYWNMSWFLQRATETAPVSVQIDGHRQDLAPNGLLKVSPDGRHAIVSAAGFAAPPSWSRYGGIFQSSIVDASASRRTFSARMVTRLFLIDMDSLATRPLWDAPRGDDDVSWAPDSRHVAISGTYLPSVDTDEAGRAGQAAAVVDTRDGSYERLATYKPLNGYSRAVWHARDFLEIRHRGADRGKVDSTFFRREREWRRVSLPGDSGRYRVPEFTLRESMTSPPRIYARDQRTGKLSLVLDLNPGLAERFALGSSERMSGKLTTGERWEAIVYYPIGYVPGHRYPLVIQAEYGTIPLDVFSLYGFTIGGTGPSLIATGVAQILANRHMVVVEASVHTDDGKPHFDTEGTRNHAAWEAVIATLDDKGVIDKTRVGVSGFSRNGYYVNYALTHSTFSYAAAIAADNYDPSYMSAAITGWDHGNADSNGGEPFGAGLQSWLKAAPGFNVEKIRTPLMLEAQTGGITALSWQWEMFSRLEYLHYPVELWAIPDYEHGGHNTQNPGQILAVQHRVIDWFEFWLLGKENSTPEKREQYENWERLCGLHKSAHPELRAYCPTGKGG